ncbi:MAG TPA: hypothetical protein PK041_04010, partial [Kaistella sp.]|nr:hypothetical protein [Kaistella sp.]
MKKTILGLDLGVSSIGWALIEVIMETYQPIRIIAMGSRIIPLDSNERDQFQKGQSISKNQDRTIARTQRKGYDRKQLRTNDLKKTLQKLNIFPTKELMELPMIDLWKLRSNASNHSENISAEQLGRIFYMLNQKRGYKSARSEANMDKKDTEYVAEVKGRFEDLKEKNKTIGENFYDELLLANNSSQYFRIKEKVYPREAYIEEFDKILDVQKSKHSFLTEDIIDKLRNEIIFYQRKLKSQKGLISFCEFESFEKEFSDENGNKKTKIVGARVAPRSSPLNQYCKVWELVNNISLKVKNPEGSKYKWGDWFPSFEDKERIADYLNKN